MLTNPGTNNFQIGMQEPEIIKVGPSGRFNSIIAAIVLGLPFIIVFFYTKGLTSGLDMVFFYYETEYHYPVILQFAKQLPFPDLTDYNSATTPLFHLLFAILSKVLGSDIQHLRLINFFITVLCTIILFRLLTREFKQPFISALLSTSLFSLSPYFFREAFVVMTDNLPVLWLLLFFQYYLRFKSNRSLQNFLFSMIFVMLLCLTRQTYLYILFPVSIDIMMSEDLKQSKYIYLALLAGAATPTFLLFFTWKGLTPPKFHELHTEDSVLNIKPLLYGWAALGFYALFIVGDKLYRNFLNVNKPKLTIALVVAWLLLFFFPLVKAKHDFGYLWYIADDLPGLHGASLLFYFLIGVGICASASIWRIENPLFYLLFIMGLFMSEIPNKFFFQRYYDSSLLILLLFLDAQYDKPDKFQLIRKGLLILLFIAYFIMYIIN